MPDPRSRLDRSAKATGTSSRVASSGSAVTHHRSPAKGRICWLQPIGDNQDAQPGSPSARSPTARSTYAMPIAAMPKPVATRADTVTWAVTAATALNTMPVSVQLTPNATDPTQGSPTRPRPAVHNTPTTTAAPMLTASAAVNGAPRPSTPPVASSSRPDSSSAREWRTVMKTNSIATIAPPNAVSLINDTAPSALTA